jgi:ferritin-like metal-binding protein YciE
MERANQQPAVARQPVEQSFDWLRWPQRTRRENMKVSNPKELFTLLLSDLAQSAEMASTFFQELVPVVQEREVKETLEARVFLSGKITETLTQCFTLIGEKPVPVNGGILKMFVENFQKQLGEMQSPEVRHLFILAKVDTLLHLRIGEYKALIATADATGHYGVGALLESCLADKLAFAERIRRIIQKRREVMKAAAY